MALSKDLGEGIGLDFASARLIADGVDTGGVAGSSDDGRRVFYANAWLDTDLSAIPTMTGVELLTQLRSPASPTRQAFDLQLPAGASLAPTDDGGAVMTVGGKAVLIVHRPTARDAQGTIVPASLTVSGQRLIQEVSIPSAGVAWPVLIDPSIQDTYGQNWLNTGSASAGPNAWSYISGGSPWASPRYNCYDPVSCEPFTTSPSTDENGGLFIYASGTLIPQTAPGWTYGAPNNTSFITEVNYTNFSATVRDGLINPFTFLGISRRDNTGWTNLSTYTGSVQATSYDMQAPTHTGTPGDGSDPVTAWIGYSNTYNGGSRDTLPQWRENVLSSVIIYLSDPERPTFQGITSSESGSPSASNWTDATTDTVTATANDPGLGIHDMTFTPPGQASTTVTPMDGATACDGTEEFPCPMTYTGATTYTLPSSDGVYTGNITTEDPLATTEHRTSSSWTVKVDRTPPVVSLSGSLWDNRGQSVADGTYALNVNATDGTTGNPSTEQSGVYSIQVLVDGLEQYHNEQACSTDSCPMSASWNFITTNYPPGQHSVEVWTNDQIGNETTNTFSITTNSGGCCSQASTSWATLATPSLYQTAYGDVNGDGASDLALRSTLTGEVDVALSNGSSAFGAPTVWDAPGNWPANDIKLADVNRDGLADLVGRDASGNVWVALSNGSTFTAPSVWGTVPTADSYYLADVDGGGQADLISFDPPSGNVSVAYSNADATGFDPSQLWAKVPAGSTVYFADATGDGLADLIYRDPTGNVYVAPSDGTAFGTPVLWATVPVSDDLAFGDMNGDDAADLVTRNPTTGEVQVGRSTGTAFATPVHWGTFPVGHDLNLADIDGNGQMDVVGSSTDGDVAGMPTNTATPIDSEPAYQPAASDESSLGASTTGSGGSSPCAVGGTVEISRQAAGARHMPLGWADPALQSVSCFPLEQAAGRIGQVGARWIRMIVLWGKYMAGGSYVDNLKSAITQAHARGFSVYMTLTGANAKGASDSPLNGQPTGTFNVDANNNWDVARISAFGSFVHAAVGVFAAEGVHAYGIWNEPNNPDFLSGACQSQPHALIDNTSLYRQLYTTGYQNATTADPSNALRVYIGELSSHPYRASTLCSGAAGHKTLNTAAYLGAIANSSSSPLQTDGIAWHPYQPKNPVTRHSPDLGIGRMPELQSEIDQLWNAGHTPQLEGRHGGRPGLYITEFGILNQGWNGVSGQSEKTERSWYMAAIKKAAMPDGRDTVGGADSFFLYLVTQLGQGHAGLFDTGTVQSSQPVPPYGYVTSSHVRNYGAGSPQSLQAYCGIAYRAYVKRYGTTYTLNNIPTTENCQPSARSHNPLPVKHRRRAHAHTMNAPGKRIGERAELIG